jgi:ribosomal protein S27AE
METYSLLSQEPCGLATADECPLPPVRGLHARREMALRPMLARAVRGTIARLRLCSVQDHAESPTAGRCAANISYMEKFVGAYVGVFVIFWLLSAIIAGGSAPRRRRLDFFVLSLLFLGPLGIGFALVAQPREPVMSGRLRYECPRCAAAQYVPKEDDSFECWRCEQLVEIEQSRFGRRWVAAVETKVPAGRRRFACARCGNAENIRETETSYNCSLCDERYTIKPKANKAAKAPTEQ